MNVWIVAIADFPEGRGATPRIRNIAAGLIERGHAVQVLLTHAAGYISRDQNLARSGVHKGIPFEFLRGTRRPSTDLQVALAKVLSNVQLALWLFRRNRPDILWLYSYSLMDVGLIFLLAKVAGIPVILDVCDERFDMHALGHAKSSLRRVNAWQSELSDRLFFRFADGFAVVSRYLEQKIIRLGSGQPVLRLPLVASIQANGTSKRTKRNASVAYLGSLTADEGLEFMVEVALKIVKHFPAFTCTLYGAANHVDYEKRLRTLVRERGLDTVVRFGGILPYETIVPTLQQHTLLVLPRSESIISRAGFPGKLSEYIASGRPIVATPFGDMPLYFHHGENVYMAKSFEPADFVAVLREALASPRKANRIAANALVTGKALFHYVAVAKSIEGYLQTFLDRKRS